MNFQNTEIAFKHKSNRDLQQARILFGVLKYPILVKVGKILVQTALKIRFPVGWILKPTLYRHFVGGENLQSCLPIVNKLSQQGLYSILDFSVEGASSESDFEKVTQEIARTIDLASENHHIAFAVFKPTALVLPEVLKIKGFDKKELSMAQQYQFEKFVERVDFLCNRAFQKSVRLLIDAEDVWYQEAIDEVVETMMKKYNHRQAIVWNTWQMYRVDRFEHLKNTMEKARTEKFYVGAKLVRGAYMEKERKRAQNGGYPSPIFPDKSSTDQSYDQALKLCIDNIDACELFNGTHNEDSCLWLTEIMNHKGLANNDRRIWTSQLYGMSDHISYNMAAQGYNVAKYIPYGPVRSVAPYLLRRAEENSAIRGQTTRELSLILKETKRRKQSL